VRERRAEDEEDARQGDERNRHLLLVRVEPRRDEEPYLRHHQRQRDDQTRDPRNGQVEDEGLGRLRVDQVLPGGQPRLQRLHHEVEQLLDEDERDQEAGEDRDGRIDDAFPELVEVLQERHLRFAIVELVVVTIAVRARISTEDAVSLRAEIRIRIEIVG